MSLYAQDSMTGEKITALSMNDAINRGIKNSEDIKIRKESIDKINSTYKEVRASVFPQVTGSFSWTRYLESPVLSVDMGMGSQTFKLKQDWEMSAGMTLTQVLCAFGRLFTAIEIAHKAMDLEQLMLETAENELVFGIKQAYYSILLAEETLRIAEKSHENALRNQKALKERYQGGRVSRVNNVKMEADVAVRIPMVLKAKTSLDTITIRFKEILNIEKDEKIALSDSFTEDFPDFELQALRKEMFEKEPMLMILRRRVSLQESMVKLKKVGYYPTLAGFMNYNYTGNSNDVVPSDAMYTEVVAGVMLNCTIFDYGALKHQYKQAVSDKKIAEMEYNKQKQSLEAELEATLTEYYSEIETYKANKRAQGLAQESYDITLSSFKSGSVSQSVLNDVELGLTSTKLETLSSLYKINVLIAKIEKLIVQKEAL